MALILGRAVERTELAAISAVQEIGHAASTAFLTSVSQSPRSRQRQVRMPDLIAEYQSLLCADESLSALDRAVDLVRRVARGGRIAYRRWPALTAANGGIQPATSLSARRVMDVANLLQSLPPRAEQPDVPEAQYSLLMDALLLVFHQAYFSLLPRAAARRKTGSPRNPLILV
jgi:hypothetical protein